MTKSQPIKILFTQNGQILCTEPLVVINRAILINHHLDLILQSLFKMIVQFYKLKNISISHQGDAKSCGLKSQPNTNILWLDFDLNTLHVQMGTWQLLVQLQGPQEEHH